MTSPTIIPPSAALLKYGSFMDRFIALLIDYILLSIFQFVLLMPAVAFLLSLAGLITTPFVAMGFGASYNILAVVLTWLYFAGFESSARGATLGKRAMRLRVVDEKGRRLTFGRASLRYVFKLVSAFPLLLGFIMALFTKKKQTLHDLVAETIVIESHEPDLIKH